MSRRFTLARTPSTIRWWARLGHLEECSCNSSFGLEGRQRVVDAATFKAIMACWRNAVGRLGDLPPREGVWATRAMYAFRDRIKSQGSTPDAD